MADVIKTKNTLQLVAGYTDGGERIINIENPKADLTDTQINAVGALAANALVSDGGAPFSRFKSAKKIIHTNKKLDLSA